jgi:probable FeS assembly SUF system protein SufT
VAVNEMVFLSRDCKVSIIPNGETMILAPGTQVWITQALGGAYTVMTGSGQLARIDNSDADAIGKEVTPPPASSEDGAAGGSLEKMVWDQLKTCYDPEIPVNIVDLGLVYHCGVTPLAEGGNRVDVRFTLTAPGCGMGEVLKRDIQGKVAHIPDVTQSNIEVVLDPPWNQGLMSVAAQLQLGLM